MDTGCKGKHVSCINFCFQGIWFIKTDKLNVFVGLFCTKIYILCLSWEKHPSSVALPEVSSIFPPHEGCFHI